MPPRWQAMPFRLSSDESAGPGGPCGPASPFGPLAPVAPRAPVSPFGPAGPAGPAGPDGPVAPAAPVGPAAPRGPAGPCAFQDSGDSFFRQAAPGLTTRTCPEPFFTQALMTAFEGRRPDGWAASATPATRASGSATSKTRLRRR